MEREAGAEQPLSLDLAPAAIFRRPEQGCLVAGEELWQVQGLQGVHFTHITHAHILTLAPEGGRFVHPWPWSAIHMHN